MGDNLRNIDGSVMVEVSNMFDAIENILCCDAKAMKVIGTWNGSCDDIFW